MHVEAKAVRGRWAGIQGGMGVESVSGPPKSDHIGSSVISLYHTRRASSAKLCISRTGQASGTRSRMARRHCGDDALKNRQSRSSPKAYTRYDPTFTDRSSYRYMYRPYSRCEIVCFSAHHHRNGVAPSDSWCRWPAPFSICRALRWMRVDHGREI